MNVTISGICMAVYSTKAGVDRKTGLAYSERHKMQIMTKDSNGRGELVEIGVPSADFCADHIDKAIELSVDVFARGSTVYCKAV